MADWPRGASADTPSAAPLIKRAVYVRAASYTKYNKRELLHGEKESLNTFLVCSELFITFTEVKEFDI
jgi:hypothetical protein